MFRYKRGVNVTYNRQGYIFFVSRMYNELPEHSKELIMALCHSEGGQHWQALHEFVTTDATATALCMKHYISKATLYRVVRRYYEAFPEKIDIG